MRTIWKFTLALGGHQSIRMPKGAQIIALQMQGGMPQIWAVVNPREDEVVHREFVTYGTGHAFNVAGEPKTYIGTYQLDDGALVFHVFEEHS